MADILLGILAIVAGGAMLFAEGEGGAAVARHRRGKVAHSSVRSCFTCGVRRILSILPPVKRLSNSSATAFVIVPS